MVAASCASSLQKFLFIVASMKRVGEFARGNGVEGSIAVGKVLPKTPEHKNGKQPVRPMPSPITCHAYSPGSLTFTNHLHTRSWA
jgi:hypothetical protein